MTRELTKGASDSIPFCVLFIIFYLSFGVLAAGSSMTLGQTVGATALIYSTPLRFILVQSAEQGLTLVPIILAMNARFSLMSGALSPWMKQTALWKLTLGAILVVPSSFSSCSVRFPKINSDHFSYFVGIGLPLYVTSIVCTWLGYRAGGGAPSPLIAPITSFLVALLFAVMAGKLWPRYFEVASFWFGLALAPLAFATLGDLTLLVGPFLVGGVVVLAQDWLQDRRSEE